jgi:ferric-dicitrate binding protein FerR (iron transport regulator)
MRSSAPGDEAQFRFAPWVTVEAELAHPQARSNVPDILLRRRHAQWTHRVPRHRERLTQSNDSLKTFARPDAESMPQQAIRRPGRITVAFFIAVVAIGLTVVASRSFGSPAAAAPHFGSGEGTRTSTAHRWPDRGDGS